MEQQMISAKQQARFDRLSKKQEQHKKAIDDMIRAQVRAYDGEYAFSTGYLQSLLSEALMSVPAAVRTSIMERMQDQTIKQLTAAVDKSRV
jgi:hypothetical protein